MAESRRSRSFDQVVGHAGLLELADEAARDVNLVQDLLQVLLGPRRGENAGAVGGKPPCDTQPDTGRGPGDDGGPARQRGAHRMIATSETARRSVMSSSARLNAIRNPLSDRRSRYR